MNRNIVKLLSNLKFNCTVNNAFCTIVTQDSPSLIKASNTPILRHYQFEDLRITSEDPRQAWVESFSSIKEEKVGLITLHPDIFSFAPRIDLIHSNIVWQKKYKYVERMQAKLPVEMRGPGRGMGPKPWPQKGTGRARQGSRRAPHWVQGGTVHGPRRYVTKFCKLPFNVRLYGLLSTFSCKLAQDDLKIVDSFDIPSDEPGYIEQLVEERCWGPSILFADADDIVPENLSLATESIGHYNILPVYGLNVYSMLKHDTLVLTVAAAERIQERMISALNSTEYANKSRKYLH